MLRSDHPETPLQMKVARDRNGPLEETDLEVPRGVILKALNERHDLLSMSFDPSQENQEQSVGRLELRSVLCVPLVRVRFGPEHDTSGRSALDETVGVLYMDSRLSAADLSAGNREALQTLAIEASTVLETTRLMTRDRERRRMHQEYVIAQQIQRRLLPERLPDQGWFRAAGSSLGCFEVGGDYYDVMELSDSLWAAVVADVSGKGLSAALLASLLQGAFSLTQLVTSLDPGALLAALPGRSMLAEIMAGINRYFWERSKADHFATVFYCTVDGSGMMRWINAGHCPALLVRAAGDLESLPASGCPVGAFPVSVFGQNETRLTAGDKLVIYTDGISEAENAAREQFGEKRIAELVQNHAAASAEALHAAILESMNQFAGDVPQNDDVTLLVLEYRG